MFIVSHHAGQVDYPSQRVMGARAKTTQPLLTNQAFAILCTSAPTAKAQQCLAWLRLGSRGLITDRRSVESVQVACLPVVRSSERPVASQEEIFVTLHATAKKPVVTRVHPDILSCATEMLGTQPMSWIFERASDDYRLGGRLLICSRHSWAGWGWKHPAPLKSLLIHYRTDYDLLLGNVEFRKRVQTACVLRSEASFFSAKGAGFVVILSVYYDLLSVDSDGVIRN